MQVQARACSANDTAGVSSKSEYVCCSDDLDAAIDKVCAVEGPNAVYCKDDDCIYYHRKPVLQQALAVLGKDVLPHADVAKEILTAMSEARKLKPNATFEIVCINHLENELKTKDVSLTDEEAELEQDDDIKSQIRYVQQLMGEIQVEEPADES